MTRYRIVVALTSLVLAFVPLQARSEAKMRSICLEGRAFRGLYSSRAIRRTKVILQMQLLELREMRLDRARAAVLRKITIDHLLDPHPALGTTVGGVIPSDLKQKQANDTTTCL